MSDIKLRATPAARSYADEHGIDLQEVKGSGARGRVHLDDVQDFKVNGRVRISPLAKRIAEVEGLEYDELQGSGPRGKIMKEDILGLMSQESSKAEEAKAEETETQAEDGTKVEKMTPVRKVIGKRMKESVATSPTYSVQVPIDMTNLLALRKQTVDLVIEKTGLKPSVTDYISLAVVKSLEKHPLVNARVSEDETEIIYHDYVSLGIAVGLEEGLYVPVVHNADSMTFTELVEESKRVIKATQDKKLKSKEMNGSTFTISNLGMFGVETFSSIINQPNTAILSVAATMQKPVVIDGEIVVRPIMNISLNADHRIIDGLEGAKFMQTLKHNLENPIGLLI